jgi:hypothetical protein
MNPLIHAKRATLICFVALACFELSPVAHSQCPTDCDAAGNTAIGIGALRNNTTGVQNTAVGADSLVRNTMRSLATQPAVTTQPPAQEPL